MNNINLGVHYIEWKPLWIAQTEEHFNLVGLTETLLNETKAELCDLADNNQ